MRHAACSEVARAFPPREAIRLRLLAESRNARMRPPRRPSALAILRELIENYT